MRRLLFVLTFFFLMPWLYATHERAGEVTYRHISGLTYEVTIVTFTYSPSPADRPELEIKWGDGTSDILPRDYYIDLTPVIRKNVYSGQHTYGGPATYIISLEDPNRNYGVVNIPNSVNIPFYVETELVINPFLGYNNSVVLLNPPLDYGCVNRLYIHNAGAYDPDGDSLSYKLVICKGAGGLPIPGYTFPQASNIFTIDAYSGDLIWDEPELQGEYNVAFHIEEWRKGQRIGYVTRDLQIKIIACGNHPPVIEAIDDTCVIAGDTLSFMCTATDPDNDNITISATGGPFQVTVSPATLELNPSKDTAMFQWNTICQHIQRNPYPTYFKATDDNDTLNLVTYKTVNITVEGPPPENPEAVPLGNSVHLKWMKSVCTNAAGYKIYRRIGMSGWNPGYCETGVPDYTGFSLLHTTGDAADTIFIDNNNGAGLVHGITYCYRITALFANDAEGVSSIEVCASLKKDVPVITNVSITGTGEGDGSVYVAWSKPTELDFNQTPGPFQYRLFRTRVSDGMAEQVQVYSSLDDTLFNDTQINTLNEAYRYHIDFFNNQEGNVFMIGSTQKAGSVFLSIYETDRELQLSWTNQVPWINGQWEIYRQDPGSSDTVLIGVSTVPQYSDTGLINGQEYCYIIRSVGSYSTPGLISPILNYSQKACGRPVDNVPPCPPDMTVITDCELLANTLAWNYPDTCAEEELIYYIYYQPGPDEPSQLVDSTEFLDYIHTMNPPGVVGCYYVTALDSLRNESEPSGMVCIDIDECGRYRLPNVFTPNNDFRNDLFMPFPPREGQFLDPPFPLNSIERVQITIFNRWGSVVFETDDPFIRWDGRESAGNGFCSEGVYFYVCDVYEKTLTGTVKRTLKGSVTLLR
ncbi:MAG: gliding motility-associated C-terminal domain-containing protein [Bacteroidales bacterium]|nr:gliding motility-associated C-terminal domain-containing protein [Bacteroidales bacterium]